MQYCPDLPIKEPLTPLAPLFLRFITGKGVVEKEKANASLVKTLVPGFRPSYTLMRNRSRLYNLIPENISLVKYGEEEKTTKPSENPSGDNTQTGGGNTPSTGDDSATNSPKISWVSILNAIAQAIIAALTALGVSSCAR